MCLHCIGKVSNCSIKSCVGVDQPMHHLCIYKSLISVKFSKFSQLSFCQKLFFLNQTPSCICSMCLHCISKVSTYCLAYMNMFAKFDENPAMTLQDIKETKRYGRTHAKHENSNPTTNKVWGEKQYTHHKQSLGGGGIKIIRRQTGHIGISA